MSTWKEICSGFVKFGNVPVMPVEDVNKNGKQDLAEDLNGNGVLDDGEDLNKDGKLDVAEAPHGPIIDNFFVAMSEGRGVAFDWTLVGILASMVAISGNGGRGGNGGTGGNPGDGGTGGELASQLYDPVEEAVLAGR